MGQRSPEIRAVQALKWGLTWRHLVPRQIESPLKKLLAVGRWGFLDSGQSWLAYSSAASL